jgi:DnaJ-class molecular chaperone
MNSHFGRDIFNLFNNRNIRENLDIKINLIISLKDIYNNSSIPISYERDSPCTECKSTGWDLTSNIKHKCSFCGGKGTDNWGLICVKCSGTGNIYEKTCPVCPSITTGYPVRLKEFAS